MYVCLYVILFLYFHAPLVRMFPRSCSSSVYVTLYLRAFCGMYALCYYVVWISEIPVVVSDGVNVFFIYNIECTSCFPYVLYFNGQSKHFIW
jgi:hypothetical protein